MLFTLPQLSQQNDKTTTATKDARYLNQTIKCSYVSYMPTEPLKSNVLPVYESIRILELSPLLKTRADISSRFSTGFCAFSLRPMQSLRFLRFHTGSPDVNDNCCEELYQFKSAIEMTLKF